MPKEKLPEHIGKEFESESKKQDAQTRTTTFSPDELGPKNKEKLAKVALKETLHREYKEGAKKHIDKLDVALETAEKKEDYDYFITKSREIIDKHGIDRLVIHGNPITDGRKVIWETEHVNNEGKPLVPEKYKLKDAPPVDIQPDLDVRGALYLLDKIHEVKPEIYNQGISIESVPKGDAVTYEPKGEKKEVMLFLDTGNSDPRIEDMGGGLIKIYADHHGEKNTYKTSATKIVNDIFEHEISKDKNLKEEAKTLQNLTTFITKYDNIGFIDEKDKDGNKIWTEGFFAETFSRSLYSLARVLPFETTLEIIKDPKKFKTEGKSSISWLTRFSKDEIENGELGKIEISIQDPKDRTKQRKLTIKEYVAEDQNENIAALEGVENCEKHMEENGINPESPITGRTLWHDFPEMELTDKKTGRKYKGKNTIKQNKAYLAAKAKGYDAIVFDNPKTGGLFTNADGKHKLRRVWGNLNKRIPGYPEPIRNIFMFEPKDPKMLEELKKISQEERLQIYGMKTDKYVAIKKERIEKIKNVKEAYAKEEEELKKQLEILMQQANK
jgi:hypothetical protein